MIPITEDVVKSLVSIGQQSVAAYVKACAATGHFPFSVISIPDVDAGIDIPALYYMPRRCWNEYETCYRVLPLVPGAWKLRRKRVIRLSDSIQLSSSSEAKTSLFRLLSFVAFSEVSTRHPGSGIVRTTFPALLVWRESVSGDGRCVYRYAMAGYPAVFSDSEQTIRWNSYNQGPVSRDRLPGLLDVPRGVVSRTEDAAIRYAESLLAGYDPRSFVTACRRASPVEYSGSSSIVIEWADALEAATRKWPGYATLAEMM
jgi:hypothetical protein